MLLRPSPGVAAAGTLSSPSFQAKWGQENCILWRRASHADFAPLPHTLSIRSVWGGAEHCHIGARTVAVDDDNFLILNDGRVYSTSIRATVPVESLAICFSPALVLQTYASMIVTLDRALACADALDHSVTPEFFESLHPHDNLVSPVLRFIRAHVDSVDDEQWYEEQLQFLLQRMIAHHTGLMKRMNRLELSRSVTRREVFRRIGLAVDYMHTNYAKRLALADLASAAFMSRYHFLRLFVLVHGITPISYLQRKRASVALRMMRTTALSVSDIACAVGFVRRTAVLDQIRRWTGMSHRQIREARSAAPESCWREGARV